MRAWFVSSLLVCVACSDGGVRSGSLPDAADFLPMATDSAEPESWFVVADTLGGEQPRLVLRCEEGRLGALPSSSVRTRKGNPVRSRQGGGGYSLDSAPSC